jgi:hypothetical protein
VRGRGVYLRREAAPCASGLWSANDAWWTDLCGMLGVPLNMTKHQCCKQTVEYSGFLFDSFRGLMQCQDEKLVLLRLEVRQWPSGDSRGPWEWSAVRDAGGLAYPTVPAITAVGRCAPRA